MSISSELILWYQVHHRNLPWRYTTDPYKIWLSEIILQQTRVDQGMAYYYRFLEKFPQITNLANADEQEVLRIWQGLGYYSRARFLHKTAQIIVNEYQGSFPASFDLLLKLKGVGEYTAAAIASHAFGLPHSVVDGNVYRFLARFFAVEEAIDTGKGQKYFKKLANEILDKKSPSIHNQAIMEFGALQCKPKNPDCTICPFKESCKALAGNKVDLLPLKNGKTKVRNRYFNYFVFQDENKKTVMKKRIENDVWHNLYDFPMVETENKLLDETLIATAFSDELIPSDRVSIKKIFPTKIHLLSHQKLHIRFIEIDIPLINLKPAFMAYSNVEIENLPLAKPIEKFLNHFLS